MNQMDFTATQMLWKPPLIKLTQIGNPDWDNGEPTFCYLAPETITTISRMVAAFHTREDSAKRHPDVSCTAVFFCHGTLHVLESPEEVARMRDEVMGHKHEEQTLRSV